MRRIASSLAFFCALTLHSQTPDSDRHERTLNNVRQFASTLRENLSCVEASSPGSSKTVTVEFSEAPHHGTASTIDTSSLLQDVFAVSSGAEFHWDHSGTLNGKTMAVYNYSFQLNGKTHAGSMFVNEDTGAISRITFRGMDSPAHLFCSLKH
jgi:hypothetical protein